MKGRYILAPQAARDLIEIWHYIKQESSRETADRVQSVIRSKFGYLADFPNAGHWRRDLTEAAVCFFPVYSYLIVYRPETKALANRRHPARPPRRDKDFAGTTLKPPRRHHSTRFCLLLVALVSAGRIPEPSGPLCPAGGEYDPMPSAIR